MHIHTHLHAIDVYKYIHMYVYSLLVLVKSYRFLLHVSFLIGTQMKALIFSIDLTLFKEDKA